MSTSTHHHRQLTLPGQTWTAEGPHNHTGMSVMHFGLRRDLAVLGSAVVHTPAVPSPAPSSTSCCCVAFRSGPSSGDRAPAHRTLPRI